MLSIASRSRLGLSDQESLDVGAGLLQQSNASIEFASLFNTVRVYIAPSVFCLSFAEHPRPTPW